MLAYRRCRTAGGATLHPGVPLPARPSRIGPYLVRDVIGRGGMGVVYRAVHAKTGEPAALKTVQVPEERHLHSLRREIRALSRIRHPSIVRIRDQGLHHGLPWYAMELVQGVSLRERAVQLSASTGHRSEFANFIDRDPEDAATVVIDLEDAPTEEYSPEHAAALCPAERPLVAAGALPAVLNLAYRLSLPLAFLHGEGIVHRDLKPENVLVRHDGRPVLMDFGLTTRFAAVEGREQLAVDGRLHGTVSYMAPEQIRGGLVDARADLYAFGVILYELLAGRLPFRSRSIGSVLYQHLEAPPIPLSDIVRDVPPSLEELVHGLLAKRPEDRVGYAEDVAAVLQALGARPAAADAPAPRPRPYLYRPRFAGRSDALATARTWLDRNHRPARGLAVVAGPHGVGKTRFAMRLSAMATSAGWAVLTASCLPVDAAGEARARPLHPLRPALEVVADRCRLGGIAATDRLLGARGPILAELMPELQTLPGQALQPPPAALPPAEARARLLTALSRTLLAWAGDQPLLLLLDDLQWADPLTLSWLDEVAAAHRSRLLVVGTVRTEAVGVRLAAALQGVPRLDLAAMARAEVGRMIADMLALPSAPAGFVAFLAERARGIPLFVAEFLRAAIAERVLTRGPGGWRFAALPGGTEAVAADALPLPMSVQRMIEARLRSLDPLGAALLDVVAVLGSRTGWDLFERVAGRWDPQLVDVALLDAVQELISRQILDSDADDEVRFVHDRIREVAYAAVDPDRRRALHAVVARTLEARHPTDPGPVLDLLGHHWDRAGEPERARDRYLAGARLAMRQYAHGDAARLYAAVLRLESPGSLPGALIRTELAEALRLGGALSQAMSELTVALGTAREADATGVEARVRARLADLTAQVGRLEDAADLYERALAAWPAGEDPVAVRVAHGEVLAALGRLDAAAAVFDADLPDEPSLAARMLAGRGRVALEQRSYAEAEDALFRARALGTGWADRVDVALDLARLHLERDAPERVPPLLTPYLEDERIRDGLRRARAEANLAIAMHRLGERAEARALLGRALGVFRELGHHRFQGRALAHLAQLHADEGDRWAAEALVRQALVLLDAVGDRPGGRDARAFLVTLTEGTPDPP